MNSNAAKLRLLLAACLVVLLGSVTATPVRAAINILLIHGRTDPNKTNPHEIYGIHSTDQMGAWGGQKPVTAGNVWYIQWDAWYEHFDSNTASPAGGWYWINIAANTLCNGANGDECYVICHSAGCAAFENYLAKSDYSTNSLIFRHVIAAESAAGGSELADSTAAILGAVFGEDTVAKIDESLTTGFARQEYNHNNMMGVLIRGTGGTSNDSAVQALTACHYFPGQWTTNPNPGCSLCAVNLTWSCSDGAVALHSSCGHNRAASFQDCNGNVPGGLHDTAGTYDYHTWWIGDNGFSGPYSSQGQGTWTSSFHTYRVDHSGGKALAVNEYSSAPADLAP